MLVLALSSGVAHAATVLVMGPGGHVSTRQDPFVPAAAPTPAPSAVQATAAAAPARPAKAPGQLQKTFAGQLVRLRNSGAITAAAYATYDSSFNAALAAERRLRGTRASELEAVIENLHDIAVDGKLTSGRLPVLFEILNDNRQWWTSGPIPSASQYVEFAGSQLVWEYYPGQGIELQVLATFGKADGLYTAGAADYSQMEQVLAQMIPLAVNRGGGPTWEYYFHFDGGTPPWTSAMSQGTAIEALTRAYEATQNSSYLQLAHQALALFTVPPPVGVRVPTALGARYVQYSFTPGTSIINAFLQSLIGLYDYAQASHDPLAQQLFNAGQCGGAGRGPPLRHRRLVAVSAGRGGPAQLPRARHRLLGAAVPAHPGARLLHHGPALHGLPDHASVAATFDPAAAQGQGRVDLVPAVEDLPRRNSRDRPGGQHAVRHERDLRLRNAFVLGPGAEAQGDLHDPHRRRPTWPATSTGSWGRSRCLDPPAPDVMLVCMYASHHNLPSGRARRRTGA